MSCSEAERAVAKEWTQTLNACVFINNRVVRTKPRSKPIVNPGLVGDVQTKDNIAHAEQAPQDAAWASWFLWEKGKPSVKTPQPLTEAEVGPDAPDHP